MGITAEYVLKKLAQNKQRTRFMHKVRYGKQLGEKFGYDRKAHEQEYQRTKNNPYNPILDKL